MGSDKHTDPETSTLFVMLWSSHADGPIVQPFFFFFTYLLEIKVPLALYHPIVSTWERYNSNTWAVRGTHLDFVNCMHFLAFIALSMLKDHLSLLQLEFYFHSFGHQSSGNVKLRLESMPTSLKRSQTGQDHRGYKAALFNILINGLNDHVLCKRCRL